MDCNVRHCTVPSAWQVAAGVAASQLGARHPCTALCVGLSLDGDSSLLLFSSRCGVNGMYQDLVTCDSTSVAYRLQLCAWVC